MTSKTVLITGAGIGIGKATAMAFGRAGYRVIVSDILEDEGRAVSDAIMADGAEAEFRQLNVTSTEQCNSVVADIEDRFGALDCLVNNAGIAHKVPLGEMTDEKWDQILDVDLKGMMRLVRAAAPGMKAAGTGSIVCLSSIMGVDYGWG